jgi:hypothetical protein
LGVWSAVTALRSYPKRYIHITRAIGVA